jgi:hypothetical protein
MARSYSTPLIAVVLLLAGGKAGSTPHDEWLKRLNEPTAIPRTHDWIRIAGSCRHCRLLAGDFYSPGSAQVNVRRHTVRVAVERHYRHARRAEAGAYDSERHVLIINCPQRTVVEGHAYLFRKGRYVGLTTFENDADASPPDDFTPNYAPLYRHFCRSL